MMGGGGGFPGTGDPPPRRGEGAPRPVCEPGRPGPARPGRHAPGAAADSVGAGGGEGGLVVGGFLPLSVVNRARSAGPGPRGLAEEGAGVPAASGGPAKETLLRGSGLVWGGAALPLPAGAPGRLPPAAGPLLPAARLQRPGGGKA